MVLYLWCFNPLGSSGFRVYLQALVMCSLALLEFKRANGTEISGARFLPEDDTNLTRYPGVTLANADLENLSEEDLPARLVISMHTWRV